MTLPRSGLGLSVPFGIDDDASDNAYENQDGHAGGMNAFEFVV